MMTIFNKNTTFKIKIISLITVVSLAGIVVIYNFSFFWEKISGNIKLRLEDPNFYICILFISVIIGVFHLIFGGVKDNSLLIFKKLGPILSSPLTALTYGVVINSSLSFFYIICFDKNTLMKYGALDQITTTITVLLLVVWSVSGFYGLFKDIIKDKDKSAKGEFFYPSNEDKQS